jgi:death-on-curing protein
MHHEIMTRLGDKPRQLLHPDHLESALARPQSRRKWGNADLVEQAAYLAAGISQAQAFEKGNKRTAFMAMRVFLRENGLRFRGDRVGLADQLIAIAVRTGSMDEAMEHFTTWLRSQCIEAPLQRHS